ncbi:MAG TPA: ABC transporter ATP-binding protein [Rhodanobacter sp.]|nr:ABC transporter ATP-binding protein [Rhodanobacter sp.]
MQAHEELPGVPVPASGLMAEIGQFGRAFKRLLGAQWQLLVAECGLARSAVSWMLLAGLAATVAGVGLGLSLLALVGLALATWWGSWLWALLALCVLQLLFLLGSIMVFRRCMYWMSLPRSRGHWSTLLRDTGHAGAAEASTPPAAAADTDGVGHA